MHDQIAVFQVGEINVERGPGRQRVRRFQPARPLDFVAAKNFRVGDHDEFRLVANKAAGERAEVNGGDIALRWPVGAARRPCLRQSEFIPNFLKPLPLAVVVAKDVDGVILPQPAVKLVEKFAALRLGDRRFGRTLGQRTEGVQVFKLRIGFAGLGGFNQLNRRKTAPVQFDQKSRPRNQKRITRRNLLRVGIGVNGQRLRLAQKENRLARQIIQQS